jgi:hypothetical protein
MLGHACNPSTQEAEAGGLQERGLSVYLVKPCLKKKTEGRKERKREKGFL